MNHEFIVSPDIKHKNFRVLSLVDEDGMSNLGRFAILRCGVVQYFHLDDVIEFVLGKAELDGTNFTFRSESPRYSGKCYETCSPSVGILYKKDGENIGILDFKRQEMFTF